MKYLIQLTVLVIMLIFIAQCTDPEADVVPIEIQGTVLDRVTSDPIADAVVRLFSPDSQKFDQTDAEGAFLLTLGVDSTFDISLITSKEGYVSDTLTAVAIPDRDVTFSAIYLTPINTGSDTGSTTIPDTSSSTNPGSILLSSISTPTINVLGSGGIENTTITFQVLDTLGYPIGAGVVANFTLGVRPDGGEYLSKASAATNDKGQVSVSLTSGTIPGIVEVNADIGGDISSEPVHITIYEAIGPANILLYSVSESVITLFGSGGVENTVITFQVLDSLGFPVGASEVVNFELGSNPDGGEYLSLANATTNESGQVSVTLVSGTVAGVVEVIAKIGDSISSDPVSITILGSPEPDSILLYSVSDTEITLFGSGGVENTVITFQVLDSLGLSIGTGEIVNFELGSSPDGGEYLSLANAATNESGQVSVTLVSGTVAGLVEVIAKIGDSISSDPVPITILGTPEPASILLTAVTASAITVIGSGGTDNTAIAFQVLDSSGVSVGKNIQVDFSMGSSPGGGEYLSPASSLTDRNGQVEVNLVSGTVSGVVQVLASIDVSGGTIRSQSVPITIHGGLPDASHFGLAAEVSNFPGYGFWGRTNTITAFAGDIYGNYCTPNTAVYFTTDGGMIGGSGLTENGSCSVVLVAAPPLPTHPTLGAGFATITARTADDSNTEIETEINILFSGSAEIGNVSPTAINVPNGGSQAFTFTVTDQNGNPLSKDTAIKVSFQGEGVTIFGNDVVSANGLKLPDTQSTGPNLTEFSFELIDNATDNVERPVYVVISTSGQNGPASVTISGSSF